MKNGNSVNSKTGVVYKCKRSPWKTLYTRSKLNAQPGWKKGNGIARKEALEVTISAEWLESQFNNQKGKCYWSGYPMDPMRLFGENFDPLAPSLERLDNKKGYVPGNVVICLRLLNLGRQAYPAGQFEKVMIKLRAHFRDESPESSVMDFIDIDPKLPILKEMKEGVSNMFDDLYAQKGPEELQEKFNSLFEEDAVQGQAEK